MDKIKLVEITKGKTGTGLLVENDGFISLDLKENKTIKEAIETGDAKLPSPFIVSAVFQKYGIENANGRIYPEDVLKREVEKYQQAIAERRAYGECYTDKAMCLTAEGWKPIADVKEGDEILTLNPETQETEMQKVTYKTESMWDGGMIHIEGSHINDTVTPNHGFPIFKFNEKNTELKFEGFRTAEELMNSSEQELWLPVTKSFELTNDSAKIFDMATATYTKVPYKGMVYCVEVPNHIWYVMENGKCHWTKNCNHPDETAIDLGRLSMNIIELHWEGHTLVGKMEIPVSRGFIELGIISSFADMIAQWIISGLKIGVSSRGMGTVLQQGDHLVVGDDYSIICWDVVSTPSTPNAWIETSPEKLQPYVENKIENKPLVKEDKFSKFEQWLNG